MLDDIEIDRLLTEAEERLNTKAAAQGSAIVSTDEISLNDEAKKATARKGYALLPVLSRYAADFYSGCRSSAMP
jgi:hypothetical protein